MATTIYYNTNSGEPFRDLSRDRKKLFLSTEPYFIKRSREDEERDLEELVDTEENEGVWLFDAKGSRWYNLVQRQSKLEENGEIVELSCETIPLEAVDGMQLKVENCSHYHTHPLKIGEIFKRQIKQRETTSDKPLSEKEKRFIDCSVAINLSLPSLDDIRTYKNILKRLPVLEIDFRIASPHGLITMVFKNGAIEADETYQNYHKMRENGLQVTHSKDWFYSSEYESHAVLQGIQYFRSVMKPYLKIDFKFREELAKRPFGFI
ncbi:MAG: hypothetical protein Q8Q01_01420 [archaeon]|nr:hypothetical protein [archaeon]